MTAYPSIMNHDYSNIDSEHGYRLSEIPIIVQAVESCFSRESKAVVDVNLIQVLNRLECLLSDCCTDDPETLSRIDETERELIDVWDLSQLSAEDEGDSEVLWTSESFAESQPDSVRSPVIDESTYFDLERTGKPALRLPPERRALFELTSEVGSNGKQIERVARWHELMIWEVNSQIVAHVGYVSIRENETMHWDAFIVESDEELVEVLEKYDPTAYFVSHGFALRKIAKTRKLDAARVERRLHAIVSDLRWRWEQLLSKAYKALDIVEEL